jgi:hypothetical protein
LQGTVLFDPLRLLGLFQESLEMFIVEHQMSIQVPSLGFANHLFGELGLLRCVGSLVF